MNIWDRLTALIIILLIPSCLLSIWLFPFEFFCGGLVGGVALFIVCNFLPPPRTDSVKRLYDILVLLWLCFCVLLAGEFLPGFILSILIPSFALLCFSYFCALITVMGAADWRWGQGFAVSDLTGAIKTACTLTFHFFRRPFREISLEIINRLTPSPFNFFGPPPERSLREISRKIRLRLRRH